MITFDLVCDNGHRFEGWFQSRETFEDQLTGKLVSCPLCDSRKITRRPSAFSVGSSRSLAGEGESAAGQGSGGGTREVVRSYFRELTNFVESNFENVGATFAEEAIKMKSGDAPVRSICGTTTAAEEEKLSEEGVEFFKMALPKYDA